MASVKKPNLDQDLMNTSFTDGAVTARLNGRTCRLRLTLGALAELEEALEADSLLALVERFERGHFSTRDLIRLITAGLRGAGNTITEEEVASMTHEDGVQGFVALAARLLAATFPGGAEEAERDGDA